MPAITLKNIPEELYTKIKKSAEINFRSINSEILFRLKSSISQKKPEVDYLLSQIHALNQNLQIPILNDKLINSAKNEGRM
jgi:antitoxin FitA